MQHGSNRRHFLASSVSLAASLGVSRLFGQDVPKITPEGEKRFKPDSLFLTWQQDPTTTMTIQWIGQAKQVDEPTILYRDRGKGDGWIIGPSCKTTAFPVVESASVRPERGADAGEAATKPADPTAPKYTGPTDLTIFRAELTKLSPGTEYEFTIGLSAPTYRFRTMPTKATKAFHFVSGGDVGIGAHALANNKVAAGQDPMFALVAGDLGYDNGVNGATALKFIQNYAATMTDSQGRLIPLVTCLGNHEVRGSYGKTLKEATFFTPLFNGLYADTSYATLDFGDYLSLVLLDTGHCAKIAGEQTAWLEKTLKDRAGKAHLIAVDHVPCYPSYRVPEGKGDKFGTGEEQRKNWCPLFDKYGVDVVLEHHDHTFKRTRPLNDGKVDEATGITYLGDGSWGKLRIPKTPELRPYLEEVSSNYHITMHRLEDEQRFHLAFGETGKVLDVHRTGKKPRNRTPGVTTR
jgi:acid phosphatase type 7